MTKNYTTLGTGKSVKFLLSVAFSLLITNLSFAQKKSKEENSNGSDPVAKIEQTLNKDENKNYEVMVLESKRIALISDEAGDITVSLYDQDLRKAATINLKSPGKGFGMNKKISSGDKMYFLFTDNKYNRANVGSGRFGFKKFVVIQVDLNTKKQVTLDGVFEKLFTMESMTESDGRIVLAGTHTYKTSTQMFRLCLTAGLCYIPYFFGSLDFPTWIDMAVLDFGKKKCNIETLDFGEKPKLSLVAANFSGEKNGSIVVRSKVKKRKYETNLYPVSLGSSIKMNDPVMLDPGADKNIWNCKINYNSEQNRVVIGTYSQLKSSYVGGFYISELNNKKVNWQVTIPLEDLFKNEYKKKKEEKTKKGKTGTAKIQGNINSYVGTHQYLFHDVMESENEYLFIAESYYPTYHTETRITYVNGKPQTTTVQVFDGYVYSKGLVFLTDKKGKLIWSNVVDLPYYRTFFPTKQFVSITSTGDDLMISVFRTFSFSNYKVDETGNMEQMESNQVKFGNKKDDNLSLNMPNSEFWYDNYYVMSGVATIKSKKSKLKSEKTSKFYVYKMEIGKELSQESEE